MDINRRFFLGGAISLIAVKSFVPSVSAMSNLPTIHGNGVEDDSYGIGALLRNEPVIFKKDDIGVDSHEGITFHKGFYLIDNTVHLPDEIKITIEHAEFIGTNLEYDQPFFKCELKTTAYQISGRFVIFTVNRKHKVPFVECRDLQTTPLNEKYETIKYDSKIGGIKVETFINPLMMSNKGRFP
jgi:hypothetical protein